MKTRKLPNRCYLPVFLVLFGSIGLETYGQVPIRTLNTPPPIKQVPIKQVPITLDSRAFSGQKSAHPTNNEAQTKGKKTVPIIGMDAFSKFPHKATGQKGSLDFAQRVPVVPLNSNNGNQLKPIPDFKGPIDIRVIPIVKEDSETNSMVNKAGPRPPVISVIPVTGDEDSNVEQVIFASRGEQPKQDNQGTVDIVPLNAPMSPEQFTNPTKPLPIIIRTGSSEESESISKMAARQSQAIQKRLNPVLITKEPEPFKSQQLLPPIKSLPVQKEEPEVIVVETEVPKLPVPKQGEEISNHYFRKDTPSKSLPPIVSSKQKEFDLPQVGEMPKIIAQPKASTLPAITEMPSGLKVPKAPEIRIDEPRIAEVPVIKPSPNPIKAAPLYNAAPIKREVLPPVVSNLPSESIPVMPLKQVVPKPVANEIEESGRSSESAAIAIPVKPMQKTVSNPFIKPPAESQSTVTPAPRATANRANANRASASRLPSARPAARLARIATPQEIINNPNITPEAIMADSATSVVGSGNFFRSPLGVLRAEALYMTRENGSVGFSDAFTLDPFKFEFGGRLHFQRIFGVEGASLTYSGLNEWKRAFATTSAGTLGIVPTTSLGLWDPFKKADFHQQVHRANYNALELNKVTWGWDVLNLFWGFRYTQYGEKLDFSSRRGIQQGFMNMSLKNHIFGPQVGGEVFYDIGGLFSTGLKVKVGGTVNVLRRDTIVITNGVTRINLEDRESSFNIPVELAAFGRMRLGPNAHLRVGYEFWYNSKIYGVRDNIPGVLDSTFGTSSNRDEMMIHGLTAGFEILR